MSKDSEPLRRLTNIKAHIKMEGCSPTVFHDGVVPLAPEDPLFGLMAAYRKDDFEKKVDLGIGAYRDNNAQPWVLPVVKKVGLANIIAWRPENPRAHNLSGGGVTSQGPQAQSRISANRWSCRLHHSSTEAHPRSRQPRHKRQTSISLDSISTRVELTSCPRLCPSKPFPAPVLST